MKLHFTERELTEINNALDICKADISHDEELVSELVAIQEKIAKYMARDQIRKERSSQGLKTRFKGRIK
jgi:hypothetical protein